jgi:hypothetical protein
MPAGKSADRDRQGAGNAAGKGGAAGKSVDRDRQGAGNVGSGTSAGKGGSTGRGGPTGKGGSAGVSASGKASGAAGASSAAGGASRSDRQGPSAAAANAAASQKAGASKASSDKAAAERAARDRIAAAEKAAATSAARSGTSAPKASGASSSSISSSSAAPTSSPRPASRSAPSAPSAGLGVPGILGSLVEGMMGPIGSMLGVGSIVEGFLGKLGSGGGGGAAPAGMGRGESGREMFDFSPAQTPASPVGTAPPTVSTGPTSCPPGYQLYTYPDGSTTCVPITSGATMSRPVAASYYQPFGGEVPQGYAEMAPQLTPVIDRGQGISSLPQGGTLPQTFPAGLSSLANR